MAVRLKGRDGYDNIDIRTASWVQGGGEARSEEEEKTCGGAKSISERSRR